MRARLVCGIAASVFAAVYVAWLVVGFGGEATTVLVADVGLVVGAAAAAGLCVARALISRGRTRLAWGLMAGASFAWALGEILWTVYEVVLSVEVPFPSVADIAYLAAIPLAAGALFAFPAAPRGRNGRARVLLDGLIVVAALLLVSWGTVLGPLLRSGGDTMLEIGVGIAYPAGDVIILSAVAAVLARSRPGSRATIVLLGCGVGAVAIADSVYTFLTLQGGYASGAPIDALWLVGYLLIAFAAISARDHASAERDERFTRLGVVIPYLAVAFALCVLGFKKTTEGYLDIVTFWTGFAVIALVVVRQFIMRLENVALSSSLEEKVRQRTAELDRALEETRASKRKEDAFVASTSHELRTPLTTIIGATSTVLSRDEQLAPTSREFLEMVQRAGARMAGLVEELIAVAGLEGRGRDITTVDLSVVVDAVVRSSGSTAVVQRLDVPRPLCARADASAVAAVLEHLLSNARKFAPGSAIAITGSRRHDLVELTVSDRGPGIPASLRERIFERFFQADGSWTRAYAGVGVGLFLARSLARSMGGTLEVVEPSGGTGASFRLALPAVVGDRSPSAAAPRGAPTLA